LKIKGAMTVLNKECEFLGLTFDELCVFIERNPYAVKNSTIDAYKVYINWKGGSGATPLGQY
tara:strand:+ start:488 stop:673 length:186 start_codon:yes stop_codon:yes gene_type:complete